jgi:glycosyltransferase involved in cell wall biosynthesis
MTTFLFFADDWGRHPSSAQYLARELARRYQVLWINTIGMRKPAFDLYTCRRAAEKFRDWFIQSHKATPSHSKIRVLNPFLIPNWRSPAIQRLNSRSISLSIKRYIQSTTYPLIGVTAIPLPAYWLDTIPVNAWVYYCVDNFTDWPGLDGHTLRNCESATITRARLLVAASSTLQCHIHTYGRTARLLTHGIDLDTWMRSARDEYPPCPVPIKKPAVMWWGLLDKRLDWSWILSAASQMPDVTFVLVGPIQYKPDSLSQYRNIVVHGAVPVKCLPAIAKYADVLMMPYADNEVTRAMQPLKLLEYLATGKPIVARRLPALERWACFLHLCDTAEEFRSCLASTIHQPPSHDQLKARQHLLRQESWQAKAKLFLEWLDDLGLLATSN